MRFNTREQFLNFKLASGYSRLNDNQVYKIERENQNIIVYSWNQATHAVEQMVLPLLSFQHLCRSASDLLDHAVIE